MARRGTTSHHSLLIAEVDMIVMPLTTEMKEAFNSASWYLLQIFSVILGVHYVIEDGQITKIEL